MASRLLSSVLLLSCALMACDAAVPSRNAADARVAAATGTLEQGLAAVERKDYATALAIFRGLAEQGDAEAQFQLARMHGDGLGVVEDMRDAERWLREAAKQGHVEAQGQLGLLLVTDPAVTQPEAEEGLALLRKLAAQGDTNAMALLYLVHTNDPRFRDPAEAQRWERQLRFAEVFEQTTRGNEAAINQLNQEIVEVDQKIAGVNERLSETERKRQALASEQRDLILEGRKAMPREMDLLSRLRNVRWKQLRLLEKVESQGLREEAQDLLRSIQDQATVAKLEGRHPAILGLRLLNGRVAVMTPGGRYVVLGSSSTDALDPAKLPRPGDQILPQKLEAALLEYEQVWTGVDADQAVQTTVQSLNALIGEYTCDQKVFGYVLSTRNTATEEPALAVDVRGVMRFRHQLGSREEAWHETEEFAPLGRMQKVELHMGRDGECSRIYVRCTDNQYCALSVGNGMATSPALSINIANAENASRAADLLGELVQRYSASGSVRENHSSRSSARPGNEQGNPM